MVRRLNITVLHCLSWLILSVMAVSCSPADGPQPLPAPEGGSGAKGSQVAFSFTIYTDEGAPAPRSRALGVWEEDAATVAERILDPSDMRVLFFDEGGLLLKSVKPSTLEYSGGETANDGYYTVSVFFSHDYFDKFRDEDIIPFQVTILANLGATGAEYIEYTPGVTSAGAVNDAFMLAPSYYPDSNGGIPMYGHKSFRVPKSQLMQGFDAPVAGTIDLIRSLCKIEVTDRIANAVIGPDGTPYPKVISVEMISWVDKGYIRPLYDDYAGGLKYANIHPGSPAEAAVTGAAVGDGRYRFYCPEAKAEDMRFRVTAVLSPGTAPKTFETVLSDYSGEIGTELVRNHIYRFDVHALNTVADLTVEVSDWKRVTDEFELDDIVSVEPDGFLSWTYNGADFAVSTETYNGNPEEQLSILNGTSDYATGTFHLISPRGATWKAYFIPGENGVDAFEFVDADAGGNVIAGSERVVAEGVVGERATVRIRGKGVADSYRHWAELVVEVHTADGNVLYAPLTSAMSSRFIIYRENRL